MKAILFAGALLIATSAAATAQPVRSHAILWQNVAGGMTRDEVRALYPASRDRVHHNDDVTIIEGYQVSERCQGTVRIFHPQGLVDRVVVRGEGSLGGRCSDTVLTALSSRYGEPLSRERNGGSILARQGINYVWNRDGVTLRFRKFTNGVFGGAGLGGPSWELTYSEIEDNVAL